MSAHPKFQHRQTSTTADPRPADGHPSSVEVQDFLRDGLLVPGAIERTDNVVMLPGADLAGTLLAELAIADELREAASAFNTRRSYGGHVRAFHAWCDEQGVSALPASPEAVAAHLASYAVQEDAEGGRPRDGDGKLIARVTVSSVQIRAAAINKLHAYAGYESPCSQQVVSMTLEGLRRMFGTRPRNARAPIDHAALRACIEAALRPTYAQVRDAVVVLLRSQGMTAAQIAGLQWADVDIERDRVRVRIPTDRRSTRRRKLVLHARPDQGNTCPVASFAALEAAHPGSVLRWIVVKGDDAKPFSRQGITSLCDARTNGEYGTLPDLPEASVASLLAEITRPSLKAARDAALLSAGWYLAQRRANLGALVWRDLTFTDRGIAVMIRRSKTDQTGQGKINWLVESPDAPATAVSPTRLLLEWRRRVAEELGGDPVSLTPDSPVLARTAKGGGLERSKDGELYGIGGSRINQLVSEYATKAGLDADTFTMNERTRGLFGAHSLRRGFVTEALRDDKLTIGQVMDITGHASADQMMRYRDEVNSAIQAPVLHLNAMLE